MKYPKVTIEDLLKYSNGGGHMGYYVKSGYHLSDIEHCYTEFLYDLDNALIGNEMVDENFAINKSRIRGKSRDYIKGHIETKIDVIIDHYMERVEKAIKDKCFTIDTNKDSMISIFTFQHLLRLNGYEIKCKEGVTTRDLAFNGDRPNMAEIPIKESKIIINEDVIKASLDANDVRGHSYMEAYLQNAKKNSNPR